MRWCTSCHAFPHRPSPRLEPAIVSLTLSRRWPARPQFAPRTRCATGMTLPSRSASIDVTSPSQRTVSHTKTIARNRKSIRRINTRGPSQSSSASGHERVEYLSVHDRSRNIARGGVPRFVVEAMPIPGGGTIGDQPHLGQRALERPNGRADCRRAGGGRLRIHREASSGWKIKVSRLRAKSSSR